MARETGATKEQLERAMRSHARWSYTSEANMERAIANGTLSADSRPDTLNRWAPHLVRADERINPVDDLIALCDAADQHLAYLRDGGPTTADQADALSATVDRVRAVIGGAE